MRNTTKTIVSLITLVIIIVLLSVLAENNKDTQSSEDVLVQQAAENPFTEKEDDLIAIRKHNLNMESLNIS